MKIFKVFLFVFFIVPSVLFAAEGDVVVSDLHDTASMGDYMDRTVIWDGAQ